jgi:hypothetical protein
MGEDKNPSVLVVPVEGKDLLHETFLGGRSFAALRMTITSFISP